MPTDYGWLSVLPPLMAIALAMVTRQVYLSLFAGIWVGTTVLAAGDPLAGLAAALDACITVFEDPGNTRVIAFSALVGALLAFTQASGGVAGFVDLLARRRLGQTPRGAQLLSWHLGVLVFVESSITSLVNGSVCRPLFDRLRLSREKLAWLCDATAAPVCILIPLNGWGAYLIGQLEGQGYDRPVEALLSALPYNLYALLVLALSLLLVLTGRDFGPMAAAERRARAGAPPDAPADQTTDDTLAPAGVRPHAPSFVLPVLTMIAMMPLALWVTGDGDLMAGSGSTSVFWAVLAGTTVAAALAVGRRLMTVNASVDLFFKGAGALLPLAVLMVLAFALGAVAKALGTGPFVAALAREAVDPAAVPAMLFLVAGVVAFSTGTSWGTFAIMIPIAVPMAADPTLGSSAPLLLGAVLGGGIFGDHASPISDTTLIASMAAGCDHIAHVNTQLPYALTAGGLAIAGYLLLGLTL